MKLYNEQNNTAGNFKTRMPSHKNISSSKTIMPFQNHIASSKQQRHIKTYFIFKTTIPYHENISSSKQQCRIQKHIYRIIYNLKGMVIFL